MDTDEDSSSKLVPVVSVDVVVVWEQFARLDVIKCWCLSWLHSMEPGFSADYNVRLDVFDCAGEASCFVTNALTINNKRAEVFLFREVVYVGAAV